MSASTTWTDGEYGRVAQALLYPLSPIVTLSYGLDVYQVAVRLRTELFTLDEPTKARVLALADQVNAAQDAYFQRLTNPNSDVVQVGDIKFDRSLWIRQGASAVEQQRDQLANVIGVPINPCGSRLNAGGMTSTWCP